MTAGTSPGGDRDWEIPEQPAGPAGGRSLRLRFHLKRSERGRPPCVEKDKWKCPVSEEQAAGVSLGKRGSQRKKGKFVEVTDRAE